VRKLRVIRLAMNRDHPRLSGPQGLLQHFTSRFAAKEGLIPKVIKAILSRRIHHEE
jgi:hypothetical protein